MYNLRKEPPRTEKAIIYDVNLKESRCKLVATRIKRLMTAIESYTNNEENVHDVNNGLEELELLKQKLQSEYQSWIATLYKERDVRSAQRWFDGKRREMEVFASGIKDWTTMAKQRIEEQLENTPSENISVASGLSSKIALERARIAELEARSVLLERRQSLRNDMERLEIEERIAVAKAREQAIIEKDEIVDPRPSPVTTPKTVPVHLPSQTREPYGDGFLLTNTWPKFHLNPSSFAYEWNEEPRTPNLGQGRNTNPAPLRIKTSPIPSSLAAKSPRMNTYRSVKDDKTHVPEYTKKEPTTPQPRRMVDVNPTPLPIKSSPIPSSLATKVPKTNTYRDRRGEFSQNPRVPAFDLKTPSRPEWKYSQTQPHQDETLFATFLDRQNKLTEILAEQHQRTLLPPLTLSIFTNDPVDFTTFITSFESQIESKVSSCDVRLRYLEQYLQGEAKELIKGCQYKDAEIGYPEAKKLLKEKYGDPYKISNAYIKKAEEWPTIAPGDDSSLDQLSTFLTQCVCAMESISYLSILDHPHNLQTLARKLPLYLQDRWRRHVITIRESKDHIPSFKKFAEFIRKEAELATDPVFSKDALAKSDSKEKSKPVSQTNSKGRTYRVTSHVANLNLQSKTPQASSKSKCLLCDENHDLDDCKKYKDKTLTERKKFLAEKQVCYGCYKSGHRSRGCIQKRICAVCEGRHPTGLHDYNFVLSSKSSNSGKGNVGCNVISNSRIVTSEANKAQPNQTVSLPIVPVKLQWMDNEISTYAMLDSCSTGTFITEDTYEKLKIKGTSTRIRVDTMNAKTLQSTMVVTGLKVSDLKGENCIELPRTFRKEYIPATENEILQHETVTKWKHLHRIAEQVPQRLQDLKVGLLIGADCPKAIEPRDAIASQSGGPYAILTFGGWAIVGPSHGHDSQQDLISNLTCATKENQDEIPMDHVVLISSVKEIMVTPKDLNNMLELEFNERVNNSETLYSQEDKEFLKIIEDGIKLEDGHYVMPLPFRDKGKSMPNNLKQAVSRTNWMKNKLVKNDKMHKDYTTFMNDLLEKDYAREVSSVQSPPEQGKVWYLPHHGVYHPHKPDKIRVVFDCSARYADVSLNSQLLQGPNLTSSLVGVLTRFRKEPIAFQADIEAMFHQVRVTEEHRNFLRFLWWPSGDLSQSLQEYQMNVHLFGSISSPSCANYAIRRTANDTESEFGKKTSDVLRKNFYVDDCLRSEETEDKAIERLHSTIKACKKGGFKLTKVTSNSRKLLETVPEQDRSKEVKNIDLSFDDLPVERALGVQWHIESDTFGFKITLKDKPLTRRGVLSTISSIYDPLGFAAPMLLTGKRILQELCKYNVNWDDPVPEEYVPSWERWRNKLFSLENLSITRCLKPRNFGVVIDQQIHSFSDASTLGYGQVSYLRQVNLRGEIHCSFLMGKARLAPIKAVTVPRMELTAAVISCKIGSNLVEELGYDVQSPTYWTDSTTVLRYINNGQARHQVFVANRVQAIRDRSDPEQWRHAPGKENPADDASRGLDVDQINEQHRWIKGPDFLWQPEYQWPERIATTTDTLNEETVNATSTQEIPTTSILERFHYFSGWTRIKRVIAWILRLSPRNRNASIAANTRQSARSRPRPLQVEELNRAEKAILKIVQQSHFQTELSTLKSIDQDQFQDERSKAKESKAKLKRSSSIFKLNPFVDKDGLLRVGGRLSKSEHLEEDLKHPIILPKKEHITTLIIRHEHEKTAHSGRGATLSEIRTKYWIINANSVVRNYITNCVKCRRYRRPGGQQQMADLPKCRITPEPPFTYSAVDLFGPFLIKDGRKELKRYGVIFTCLSSRAVHLETVTSLETDTFINALRRFTARRGPIREIHSDQGTNLMGAERELKTAFDNLDDVQLQDYLSTSCNADWVIKWKRNPPAASHMGGAWERQIRTVRSILNALMHEHGQRLDDESFRTLLIEVESIINCRPLVFPSSDSSDVEPLTPNSILTMKSKVVLPPAGTFQKEDLYLRKRWKRVQFLANLFWSRWRKEYIQSLQPRGKWNRIRRNYKIGDVVLIIQDSAPRNVWPLGRIVQVKTDSKNLVRSATVRTSITTLERPIAKLVLLLEQDAQQG